jgi:uncharacterized protein (TIGR02246 family)
MRLALASVFMIALTIPAFAQAPAAAGGADAAAIRQLVQQQDDTRNRGDLKAFGALFTDDADQLTSSGEWRRGRAAIEAGVTRSRSTVYKGGKYVTKIETVRMLSPNIAIADGPFEILNLAGGGTRRVHATYLLVKSGDRWRIAGYRSMVPAAAGATPAK